MSPRLLLLELMTQSAPWRLPMQPKVQPPPAARMTSTAPSATRLPSLDCPGRVRVAASAAQPCRAASRRHPQPATRSAVRPAATVGTHFPAAALLLTMSRMTSHRQRLPSLASPAASSVGRRVSSASQQAVPSRSHEPPQFSAINRSIAGTAQRPEHFRLQAWQWRVKLRSSEAASRRHLKRNKADSHGRIQALTLINTPMMHGNNSITSRLAWWHGSFADPEEGCE